MKKQIQRLENEALIASANEPDPRMLIKRMGDEIAGLQEFIINGDAYKAVIHLPFRMLLAWAMALTLFSGVQAHAAENEDNSDLDVEELSSGSENASNPLAAVNNTDLRC
ncbi:MAG: hypothetical protein GY732_02520 [Gammaproteobacteria bacterium]|nr:hypothetical protein [Gammaproteobacteria bacterium]